MNEEASVPTTFSASDVAAALDLDIQLDGVRVHDAGELPDRLALYVPNLFIGVEGSAAATAVADLLERSLPPNAPVTLVTEREAGPEVIVEHVERLRVITIDAASAVFIPSVDVRVEALGAIYAADVLGADDVDVSQLSKRAAGMAAGTWADRPSIDAVITAASDTWRIDRMPVVDRSLLRLGTYELLHTDLPTGVVLDEAVTLAKAYSTEASGRFVNGVLDAIARARSDVDDT